MFLLCRPTRRKTETLQSPKMAFGTAFIAISFKEQLVDVQSMRHAIHFFFYTDICILVSHPAGFPQRVSHSSETM